MRIALITTGLGIGGSEKVVVTLADSFVCRGHTVLIVYLTGAAEVLPANKDVQVIGLGLRSSIFIVGAYLKLRRLLKAFQADVVHSHSFHANILTRLVRMSMTIPRLISTAHNTIEGGRMRMLAYRFTDSLANITTNVSDEAVASFVAKGAVGCDRMITVYNGISTKDFSFNANSRDALRHELGLEDKCKLILAVGSLSEQKDYPNLLEALKQLITNTLRYTVCIVGDGPLKAELAHIASQSGLADQVHFLGSRNDVARLLSATDVFVLSSAWEGFGLVVAEAMSCERVVVATDCGGVKEVLGDAGLLVEPRQPAKLAAALDKALTMPMNDAADMGRSARARVVEHFSLDTAVEKWLKLYSCDSDSEGVGGHC